MTCSEVNAAATQVSSSRLLQCFELPVDTGLHIAQVNMLDLPIPRIGYQHRLGFISHEALRLEAWRTVTGVEHMSCKVALIYHTSALF